MRSKVEPGMSNRLTPYGAVLVAAMALVMAQLALPAVAAEAVSWSKRTVGTLTFELPASWVEGDSDDDAHVFLETPDASGGSLVIYRDIDLTHVNDGDQQISSSSAVIDSEVGRRIDWRRGPDRGATIILSDRQADGGQIAIVFSAPQNRWNALRQIFRHTIRSIQFTGTGTQTAEAAPRPADDADGDRADETRDDGMDRAEQPADARTAEATRPPAADAREEAEDQGAVGFRHVAEDGFELRIPANWEWSRMGVTADTAFETRNAEGTVVIRFGLFKPAPGGSVEEPYYRFVDGVRELMASDELVDAGETNDDGAWYFREVYEGESQKGDDATIEVLLADDVDPAIAMAILTPRNLDADTSYLIDAIRESVTITAKPAAPAPDAAPAPQAAAGDDAAAPDKTEDPAITRLGDASPVTRLDEAPPAPQDETPAAPEAAATDSAPEASDGKSLEMAARPSAPTDPTDSSDTGDTGETATPPAASEGLDATTMTWAQDETPASKAPAGDTAASTPPADETPGADAPAAPDAAEEPQAETTPEPEQEVAALQPAPQASAPADLRPSAGDYIRRVPDLGLALRVPGGWTIQEERGDGVATWRLRDKAWRNGGGSSGLYAVTVSVSTAEPGAEAEKLFRDTVEHFKTKVLADAAVTGEGTAAFADRQFLQADIAGTLDAKTDTPHPAVLRVMTDKQGDKLVVVTAFASPDAAAQLGMAVAPAGLVAPLAAQ